MAVVPAALDSASKPSACRSCGTTTDLNDFRAAIRRLEEYIRKRSLVLILYALIMVASIGLLLYVLWTMYTTFRQWRVLSDSANPQLKSGLTYDGTAIDGFDGSFSLTGAFDDEVYASELRAGAEDAPLISDRIKAGMDRLEARYAQYNKQIAQYSKEVLREKEPQDVVDRRVLDASKDDFK